MNKVISQLMEVCMLGPFVAAVTDTQKMYWPQFRIQGKPHPTDCTQGRCLQLGLQSEGNQAYFDYLSVLCLHISFILFRFVNTLE